MTARMRRIASDLEQVKKDFAGHKNIMVTPIGGELPEKYHVKMIDLRLVILVSRGNSFAAAYLYRRAYWPC